MPEMISYAVKRYFRVTQMVMLEQLEAFLCALQIP